MGCMATTTGVDKDGLRLAMAQANADSLGLADEIDFVRADLVAKLGDQLSASQLDPDIAYLTAEQENPNPFSRDWESMIGCCSTSSACGSTCGRGAGHGNEIRINSSGWRVDPYAAITG